MYLDIALVVFFGYSLGLIFEKFNIPKIVGMIIACILIGPFCLDLICRLSFYRNQTAAGR